MSRTQRSPALVLSVSTACLAAVVAVTTGFRPAAVPAGHAAIAGPPWISIEYPVNPFDRTTRGAHLLVHAYYHGTPVAYPVSGTAEGVVNGERRTITLRFETTSRTGVYALRKQWPSDGAWTLVIAVNQGDHDRGGVAQALIELAPSGAVASVQVPTQQHPEGTFPRRLTAQEIETAVRAHAQRIALAGRPRG
ncbi:MAG: hypothetical protein ABR499_06025 [Gemmatimonadaceae bacterium]